MSDSINFGEPILVIDDSADDREAAQTILSDAGATNILCAEDLESAIEVIKKKNVKQVVLDLGGVTKESYNNPLAALETLEQAQFPGLKIIVLSGNKNPKIEEKIREKGYPYLLKDPALDISAKSNLLPNAILQLDTESNLIQNAYIREGLLRQENIENRMAQLESRLNHLPEYREDISYSLREIIEEMDLAKKEIESIKKKIKESSFRLRMWRFTKNIFLYFVKITKDLITKYTTICAIAILTFFVSQSWSWLPAPIKQLHSQLQKIIKQK